ncbi:MAG: geranylgeranyl reductase family protein [Actinobacteria bacterium]|nr:geranylgeranyl reductase family protein [Actinomycetota bacterium]
MEKVDVVVVGAGPSGSAAAYFLARRGVEVLLFDKSKLPREKTCGDGLGPRGIEVLDKMGLEGWLIQNGSYRCDRVRLFLNNGDYFEAGIPSEDTLRPCSYIMSRKDLDLKLAETARAAGARVATETKAIEPVRVGGAVAGILVEDEDGERQIGCRVIVCADGTLGTFAAKTGIDCVKPHAFAVRAYYDGVKNLDDCINIFIEDKIREGYAWIFPTGEQSANIGIGLSTRVMKEGKIDARRLLGWFMSEKKTYPIDLSDAVATTDVKGAYLRMGYGRHDVVADGLVLTGDAAGLISPMSGEGIAYALESGEIAADVIKEALDKGDVSAGGLAPYKKALDKAFLIDHRIYEFLRESLARPSLMNRVVVKARLNPDFAGKFVSVMMGTARPLDVFTPKMLWRLFGPDIKRG